MSKDAFNLSGRGAAAPTKFTYSAQDLAEMYMTSREDFLGLDMEEVTNGWNLNYIYDFLYYIRNVDLFDDIIDWIAGYWQTKHQYYNSYDKVSDSDLELSYINFRAQLQFVKEKLKERFESERHTEELRNRMLLGYEKYGTETKPHPTNGVSEGNHTGEPSFVTPNQMDYPEYHMSDLTKESQDILLIKNDHVFSMLTDVSRNLLWPWIKKNKLKSANVVRLIFRYAGFISRKTSVLKFTNLFNQIVPEANLKPDTVSSYSDANIDDLEKYEKMEKWKRLRKDGDAVLKLLQPVIEIHEAA